MFNNLIFDDDLLLYWAPVVRAAGMWDETQDAANVFVLAGVIIKNPEVCRRKARTGQSVEEVLAAMTPAELTRLQNEIKAKYPSAVGRGEKGTGR
jgi:hypothetical protein